MKGPGALAPAKVSRRRQALSVGLPGHPTVFFTASRSRSGIVGMVGAALALALAAVDVDALGTAEAFALLDDAGSGALSF
ncbi:MAG TPA: hypothetical protein VF316_17855 [Polyangiaceae bacterium]